MLSHGAPYWHASGSAQQRARKSPPSWPTDAFAIAEVERLTGSGSAAKRRQVLGELLGRATDQEADFARRLFTGS